MSLRLSIQGLQQAQQASLRAVRAVKPDGGLGRAVKWLATFTHLHLTARLHVDTGSLRAATLIQSSGLSQYTIYVNPSARNPRSRALVEDYAEYEEDRGGDHAAWRNTVDYAQSVLVPRAVILMTGELV